MISGTKRQWLLPALVVLGMLYLLFAAGKSTLPTGAQAQPRTGAREEVLVIPVQIDRDSYGLAMVDTIGQTLWIYELNNKGPAYNRLKLLAARSWRYDRLLQQYNTAEPKPDQVKILLETLKQQQKKTQDSGTDVPEKPKTGNKPEN